MAQINTSNANGFLTSKRRVSSKLNIQNYYPAAGCIHVQSWEREATALVCLIVFRFRYGWQSTKMIASSVIGSRPWFSYLLFNWVCLHHANAACSVLVACVHSSRSLVRCLWLLWNDLVLASCDLFPFHYRSLASGNLILVSLQHGRRRVTCLFVRSVASSRRLML